MTKKLTSCLLITLLSTFCLTTSASYSEVNPKEAISKHEVLDKQQQEPAEETVDKIRPSFKKAKENYWPSKPVVKFLGHFILRMGIEYLFTLYHFSKKKSNNNAPTPQISKTRIIKKILGLCTSLVIVYTYRWVYYRVDELIKYIEKKAAPYKKEERKQVTNKNKVPRFFFMLLAYALYCGFFALFLTPFMTLSIWVRLKVCFLWLASCYIYDAGHQLLKYLDARLANAQKKGIIKLISRSKALRLGIRLLTWVIFRYLLRYLLFRDLLLYQRIISDLRSFIALTLHYTISDMVDNLYAKKKVDLSMPSFKQDIKNHPFFWIGFSFCSIIFYLAQDTFLTEYTLDLLYIKLDVTYNPWSTILTTLVHHLLVDLVVCAIISLLLAGWDSLWGDEDQKGEEGLPSSPPVRLWRSFRFMCMIVLITPIMISLKALFKWKIPDLIELFVPFMVSMATYVIIWMIDASKEGKKQVQKPPREALV